MPTPREHAKQVRAYDDVFLACRDLRHHWQVVGFYRSGDGFIRRVLDCERCGTQRNDKWRMSGERFPSSYSYAEQYRVEEGFDTWEVRKEVLHRSTIFDSEAAMIAALTKGGAPKVRRGK